MPLWIVAQAHCNEARKIKSQIPKTWIILIWIGVSNIIIRHCHDANVKREKYRVQTRAQTYDWHAIEHLIVMFESISQQLGFCFFDLIKLSWHKKKKPAEVEWLRLRAHFSFILFWLSRNCVCECHLRQKWKYIARPVTPSASIPEHQNDNCRNCENIFVFFFFTNEAQELSRAWKTYFIPFFCFNLLYHSSCRVVGLSLKVSCRSVGGKIDAKIVLR